MKVTDTQPDDWVVVSGIGGLGHLAVQYAKAMGLNVIAVDVDDAKLDLARSLGAALAVKARTNDPVAFVKREVGGAQGVLVTAVSTKAFEQALGMVGRGGTVRGSIVGTRLDLQEALNFAGDGKVKATVETGRPARGHQSDLRADASRRHPGARGAGFRSGLTALLHPAARHRGGNPRPGPRPHCRSLPVCQVLRALPPG